MAGKSGKRETGKKPSTSTRTDAKADGAFGKEQESQLKSEIELNTKKAVAKRLKKEL